MGDRLNNNRVPHQRTQAAASSRSNNVSDRSDITLTDARPRPTAGPLASARKPYSPGVAAFLQAFPSLEEVHRKFPEFVNLTLPDVLDKEAVASFEKVLGRVLDRERCSELTDSHAPADILRGLSELRTRQDGGKAVPARHGRSEAADRPPEDKRDAGRLRRPRATLPNYLMNRETGSRPHPGDGLPHRFAAVRQDRLASMAIAMNCDRKMVSEDYQKKISNYYDIIKKKYPDRFRFVVAQLEFYDEMINYKARLPNNCLKMQLSTKFNTQEFFANLIYGECILRLLDAASCDRFLLEDTEGKETALPKEVAAQRFCKLTEDIIAQTSREILSSFLVFEQAQPEFKDRSPFEKTLVASLATLYHTGDFIKANATFRSGLKTFFPGIPVRSNRETRKAFAEATEYAEETSAIVSEYFQKDDQFNNAPAFAGMVAFYYQLTLPTSRERAPGIALSLNQLFDWAGAKRSS